MAFTLNDAQALIRHAQSAAALLGKPVSVTVVDAAGHLLALERMDGCPWFTAEVSQAKACTAADMRGNSAAWADLQSRYPDLWRLISSKLPYEPTTLGGGILLRDGDVIVGAIGISGATEEDDIEIAVSAAKSWTSSRT